MPKTPKGHKRPTDVIANAVTVMRIATGDIEEAEGAPPQKDAAAVALGRRGGQARAKSLSPRKRKSIAAKAARERWGDK